MNGSRSGRRSCSGQASATKQCARFLSSRLCKGWLSVLGRSKCRATGKDRKRFLTCSPSLQLCQADWLTPARVQAAAIARSSWPVIRELKVGTAVLVFDPVESLLQQLAPPLASYVSLACSGDREPAGAIPEIMLVTGRGSGIGPSPSSTDLAFTPLYQPLLCPDNGVFASAEMGTCSGSIASSSPFSSNLVV